MEPPAENSGIPIPARVDAPVSGAETWRPLGDMVPVTRGSGILSPETQPPPPLPSEDCPFLTPQQFQSFCTFNIMRQN